MAAAGAIMEFKEGDWSCVGCGNHNFANRNICNKCRGPKPPPAGTGREGDWLCPMCTNHNYARRHACNKCNSPKPGSPMAGMPQMMMGGGGCGGGCGGGGGGGPSTVRAGDWSCPSCKNHNYQSRLSCNKCQVPKPANAGAPPPMMYGGGKGMGCGGCGMMGGMVGTGGGAGGRFAPYPQPMMAMAPGGKGMRPGDWMCPGCGNHNYANRDNCNKCARAKNLPQSYREGDWICPSCSNHNFASKTECNKCKEPKAA